MACRAFTLALLTLATAAGCERSSTAVVDTLPYPDILAIEPTLAGDHVYRGIASLTPGSSTKLNAVGYRDRQLTTRYPTWDSSIADQRVTWTSRSPEIATVDAAGSVLAKSPGRATIVASSLGESPARDSVWVIVLAEPVRLSKVMVSDVACGVSSSGEAYCWGINAHGELADGTVAQRDVPAYPVTGGHSFKTLSIGNGGLDFGAHVCGIATDETTYCWGYNRQGQTGTGTNASVLQPTPVVAPVRFSSVVSGSKHTCALATDGAAYCWGSNGNYELGDSTTISRSVPTRVRTELRFTSLALGEHSCGLDTLGEAYCWGWGLSGALGTGSTVNEISPTRVLGGHSFVQLIAAEYETCGLTAAGEAFCWGDNDYGQLGDGTTTARPSPVAVSGGITFASLAAVHGNTCGLTTEGKAYCWGWNGAGRVGDGTHVNRLTPTAVTGNHRFTSLSIGRVGACGLASDGLYCWSRWLQPASDGAPVDPAIPTLVPAVIVVP
jgi:hypothetical protein